nr:probable alpha,alpha-trehalose-phosphate synthase [UDP-forming] 7 [Tanacetum cinerariifolium]
MRNATLVCSKEVVNVEASKGLAAEKIFTLMAKNRKQADFVLCIGNDRSNEDMFEIIGDAISRNMLSVNTNVFACTSGQKSHKAKYYLDDTSKVILLLENLAEATDSPVISDDDSE